MRKTVKSALLIITAILAVQLLSFPVLIYVAGVRGAKECRDWSGEFAEYRRLLKSESDPAKRLGMLAEGAKAGAEIGEYKTAEAWATEALTIASFMKRDWNYGNVVHDCHMALGRAALARGHRDRARQELVLAGRTPGSPQLNSFGPNMSLARDMLREGEREATIQYFRECARFWELGRGRLHRWELLAKWHLPPDFGANLLF